MEALEKQKYLANEIEMIAMNDESIYNEIIDRYTSYQAYDDILEDIAKSIEPNAHSQLFNTAVKNADLEIYKYLLEMDVR